MARAFPRSIFGRLTWLSVGIGLAVCALLYGAAELAVRRHANASLTRMIDTDMAGLVDIQASGGSMELRRRIADRLALAPQESDPPHYLLADGAGRRLAGDLAHWPPLSAENSELRYIRLPSGVPVLARATQIGPDLKLVVAREYGERNALLWAIRIALLIAGALAVLLIVLAGRWAARALRRRVQAINTRFSDMAEMLPASADADELDILSGHVARELARRAELIVAHRNISDQIAHELRTPLMHLDMKLLRLIEQACDPQTPELVAGAREEIRRIIRMLESLLDIAANEAQRGDTARLPEIDLSEIAASIADLFAESAQELGLVLETQVTPGVMMRGDAMQMTRLFSNLLDNALKYVPDGGTVGLMVDPGPRIIVVDDGAGIPPEKRERIFERFERSGSVQGNGHGLGLALVRAIAERHGLVVRCEDACPGAAFIIERGGD